MIDDLVEPFRDHVTDWNSHEIVPLNVEDLMELDLGHVTGTRNLMRLFL